jgi:hypothetical protein
MNQIPLVDIEFQGNSARLGYDSFCVDQPSFFSWKRNLSPNEAFCIFTDRMIESSSEYKSIKKKIAWVVEPPEINPRPYNYVATHSTDFYAVLTHSLNLLKQIPNGLYVPVGASYIPLSKRRLLFKKQLLSIICSKKRDTLGHKLRHIASSFVSSDHRFGYAFQPFDTPDVALSEYCYSVVVENSKSPGYFTEKIINCFSVGTIPIYWGSSYVSKIFNTDGIIYFDSPNELSAIIKSLSFEDYKSRLNAVIDNYRRSMHFWSVEDSLWIRAGRFFET